MILYRGSVTVYHQLKNLYNLQFSVNNHFALLSALEPNIQLGGGNELWVDNFSQDEAVCSQAFLYAW